MDPNFSVIPIEEIASSVGAGLHRPFVLVVDNDMTIADTLAAILSLNGYASLAAYEGSSALKIAETYAPSLLLSNIVMPGLNGVELAMALNEKFPACKVILLSGQSGSLDVLSEAQAAGYHFPTLTKPIPPEVLLDCISGCLAGRKLVDAPHDGYFTGSKTSDGGMFSHSLESDANKRRVYPERNGSCGEPAP